MGLFSSLLHPGKPYKKAREAMNQQNEIAQGYYAGVNANIAPYSQAGQQQLPNLNSAIQNLMNPQQMQNNWLQDYQVSPYAQQLRDLSTQSGLNDASSSGLLGSSPFGQALGAGTSQIINQDRQQYLDNLMKMYMGGVGLSQGIYGTGAGAAAQQGQLGVNQANQAMQQGQNNAQMAYGQSAAPGNLIGSLLGGATGLFGSGPLGKMMWNTMGNR